ncbi:MAG: nitrite reductase small subunit NirD [Acidimicrobiia bacterium]
MTLIEARTAWVEVCSLGQLTPDRGVAALVGGEQVAVFHLSTGEVFALGNRDPFSGVNALSRGIVGDAGGVPMVASPVYKQRFDLRTGVCVDDEAVAVPVYPVRLRSETVEVALLAAFPGHAGRS